MNKLRAMRFKIGMSIEDFANEVGVSTSTISNLESGAVPNPSVQVLDSLANVLSKHLPTTKDDLVLMLLKEFIAQERKGRRQRDRRYVRVTADVNDKAWVLYQEGYTLMEIAAELDLPYTTTRLIIVDFKEKHGEPEDRYDKLTARQAQRRKAEARQRAEKEKAAQEGASNA